MQCLMFQKNLESFTRIEPGLTKGPYIGSSTTVRLSQENYKVVSLTLPANRTSVSIVELLEYREQFPSPDFNLMKS